MTKREAEPTSMEESSKRPDGQLAEFRDWLDSHSCDYSNLSFEYSDGIPIEAILNQIFNQSVEFGMSAFAKRDLTNNDKICEIPNDLILTETRALETEHGKAILNSKTLPATGISAKSVLFAVLVAQREAEDSKWGPYLRMIPEEFSDAHWFSKDEMQLLKGTNLFQGVQERVKALLDAYERLFPALSREYPDLFPSRVFTWPNYLWAASAFHSRCFPARLLQGRSRDSLTKDITSQAERVQVISSGEAEACMLPLLDMLNHKPMTAITWLTGDNSLQFVTNSSVRQGEQVFNNYGPRGNEELALLYGFGIPNNPHDYVAVRLAFPKDAIAEHRQRILSECGLGLDFFLLATDPIPSQVLAAMRVCTMTEKEFGQFGGQFSRTQLDSPLSAAAELTMLEALRAMCERRVALIRGEQETDQEALNDSSLAPTVRTALIYRMGQRDILRRAVDIVKAKHAEILLSNIPSPTLVPLSPEVPAYFVDIEQTTGQKCLLRLSDTPSQSDSLVSQKYVLAEAVDARQIIASVPSSMLVTVEKTCAGDKKFAGALKKMAAELDPHSIFLWCVMHELISGKLAPLLTNSPLMWDDAALQQHSEELLTSIRRERAVLREQFEEMVVPLCEEYSRALSTNDYTFERLLQSTVLMKERLLELYVGKEFPLLAIIPQAGNFEPAAFSNVSFEWDLSKKCCLVIANHALPKGSLLTSRVR